MDAYNGFDKINNNWQGLTQLNIFKERIAYDPNGNILKYLRHGHRPPFVMDSLSYHYYPGTNRLNHVTDQVAAATFGNGQNDVADIDSQNPDNYHYDEIGNLVKDIAEGIDKITWTVYGKISSIEKANGTTIQYSYDPSENRISKLVQRSSGTKNYTWYVRDAQGNVMATYTANGQEEDLADLNLKLSERHLYGSSRLGILTEEIDVDNNNEGPAEVEEITLISYYRGYRQYELSNHLGNVLATVSDKKSGIDSDDDEDIDYFEPEIITASDYYPFGMQMPGRGGSLINGEWEDSGPSLLANLSVSSRNANEPIEYIALESIEFLPGFESGSGDEFIAYITTSVTGEGYEGEDGLYRYGFNGKENDNETRTQDYGMRIYNPGLGRFLSVDPLTDSYPWYTPYQFAGNKPINSIDLDGLEEYESYDAYSQAKGKSALKTMDGFDGAWLASDRKEKTTTWSNAMAAITKNKSTDKFKSYSLIPASLDGLAPAYLREDSYSFGIVRDYYNWVQHEMDAKGFSSQWAKGASYLSDELADTYEEGAVSGGFTSMGSILKGLSQSIAGYAVGKFSSVLYGGETVPNTKDGWYTWDANFVMEEQVTKVAPQIYQSYAGTRALNQLNRLSRKKGLIGGAALLFSKHFFPSFAKFGVNINDPSSQFGAQGRYNIPLLMLYPFTHQSQGGVLLSNEQFEEIWKAHNAINSYYQNSMKY